MIKNISILLSLAGLVLLTTPSWATNVGTGITRQLTYLGEASEKDRIPLSPVICNSNYNYGTASAIFQSRPCYHGGMLDDGRIQYEQNLAVLFGISCKLSDPTQFHGCTATFTLSKATPPSNASYSLEQVLAASLQVLLRHGTASKKHPFTVVIKGDGIPTPKWAKKYAKAYYREKGKDGKEKGNTQIPGIKMETTSLGVTYLIFEGVDSDPTIKRRDPAFILFRVEGDCDNRDMFVPVWYGDTWGNPANVMFFPCLPYYEKCGWNRYLAIDGGEYGAVPYISRANHVKKWQFKFSRTEAGISLQYRGKKLTAREMANYLDTWILNLKPTEKCPLTVSFPADSLPENARLALLYDSAWDDQLSCEFVLDNKTGKLLKGSIPYLQDDTGMGGLSIFSEQKSIVKPTTRFELEKTPGIIGYSPCGQYMAAVTARTLSMIEIATSKIIFKQAVHGSFSNHSKVIFSSDSRYVTINWGRGYNGSILKVFEVNTGKIALNTEHDEAIRSIKFAPDAKSIGVIIDSRVRGSQGIKQWKALQIYDLSTSKIVYQYAFKKRSALFEFSPNSKRVAVYNESLYVLDILTGETLFKQEKGDFNINMIRFAPDEKHVAAVGSSRVVVSNITTGKTVEHFPVSGDWHSINFSPDGEKLAITTKGKNKTRLTIYAFTTSEIISQFDLPGFLRKVAFLSNWKYVGVDEYNGWLSVYEVSTGRKIFTNNKCGECFSFSPDGNFIASNPKNESIEIYKFIFPKK